MSDLWIGGKSKNRLFADASITIRETAPAESHRMMHGITSWKIWTHIPPTTSDSEVAKTRGTSVMITTGQPYLRELADIGLRRPARMSSFEM